MGEFMTYQAVKSLTGDFSKGIRASCGWGGDAVFLFAKGKDRLTVWYTTWDTQKDTDEFFGFFCEGLKKSMSPRGKIQEEDKSFIRIKDNISKYFKKSGKDAVYISSSKTSVINTAETLIKDIQYLSWDQRFPKKDDKAGNNIKEPEKGDNNE